MVKTWFTYNLKHLEGAGPETRIHLDMAWKISAKSQRTLILRSISFRWKWCGSKNLISNF